MSNIFIRLLEEGKYNEIFESIVIVTSCIYIRIYY